jgi:hypothetical protein
MMAKFNVLDGNGAVLFSHDCILQALDAMHGIDGAESCTRDSDGELLATPDFVDLKALHRRNRGIPIGIPQTGVS